MAKYLVETYYTCSLKITHYLDNINEKELLKTRSQIKAKHVQKRQLEPIDVIAIIPVRGHSMDLRSNPLKKIGGKCLIDWTIDSAINSKLVTKVIVTSPDEKVFNHIQKSYPEVIFQKRDMQFAQINTAIKNQVGYVVAYRHWNGPNAIGSIWRRKIIFAIIMRFYRPRWTDHGQCLMRKKLEIFHLTNLFKT